VIRMTGADMYMEQILDHYKNPRNKHIMEVCDIDHRGVNPLCGDDLRFMIKIEKSIVTEAAFDGKGCAISQASASMLTEKLVGMKLEDVKKLKNDDIFEMLGIHVSPARVKCALLSLKVLEDGIKKKEE
jgi:nitrogen fixation protein NifU and related proteins